MSRVLNLQKLKAEQTDPGAMALSITSCDSDSCKKAN